MFDCFCKDDSNEIQTTNDVLPLPPPPLMLDPQVNYPTYRPKAPIPARYQTSGGRLATQPDTIWMAHYTAEEKGWRGRRRDLFYNPDMDGSQGYPHVRDVYYGEDRFSWEG